MKVDFRELEHIIWETIKKYEDRDNLYRELIYNILEIEENEIQKKNVKT